jgi:hypothetical protein
MPPQENYKKNEPTFKNRRRYLCVDCWTTGTPHVGRHVTGPSPEFTLSYNFAPGSGDFCVCTVKDGFLCTTCKNEQNLEAKNAIRCAGQGCNNFVEEDKESRRICLWCDLPLLKSKHRSENRDPRKEYNFGYVFEGKIVEDKPMDRIASWTRRQETRERRPRDDVFSLTRSRFTDFERRRIERLLNPDETGAQYVRHLAEIDYKAFGARRPHRKRVMDSMKGIFKYDLDFLMQFEHICTKEPSEDWWMWMTRIMVDEDNQSANGEDRWESFGETANGKKRKSNEDEDGYAESSARSSGKGKKKDVADDGLPDVPTALQDPLFGEGDYYVVEKTGLSNYSKEKEKPRAVTSQNGRTDVAPGERPPDYNISGTDLLLDLDEPSNGGDDVMTEDRNV